MNHPLAASLTRLILVVIGVAVGCGQMFGQPARQSVRAQVPEAAKLAQPLGRMPSTGRISFAITLPFRDREALTNLLREIADPASPNYRHYLTREEFTDRFGPTEKDYEIGRASCRARV